MWAGPNAVLAFAREGYLARQISVRDLWDTVSYRGFRRFARRNWRTGLGELRGDLSQRAFVAALQRLVPGVRPQHLAGTHSGIRAQALDDDGRLVDDFRFDYAENVVHVRNAPSPGATSSLAIVSHMLDAVAISLLRSKRPRCPMPQVAFTLGVNKAEDLHDCGEVGTDSWGLTVTALRNELGGHEEGTSWGKHGGPCVRSFSVSELGPTARH